MTARTLLSIEDARTIVLASVQRLPSEPVALTPSALGRVLAEDLKATEAVPPFDNSAMDGFAVRALDVAAVPASLTVVGESRAGSPANVPVGPEEAIAIATGAAMPAGADAVVRVEDTRCEGDVVEVLEPASVGQEVRRAGDDVRAGQAVLPRGTPLGPAELGVAASLGRTRLECARRPRVAVLVTGDELLEPGESMRPGAVRDSNSLSIPALALAAGAELLPTARAPDEPSATRAAIASRLDADVLVICGGMSVGQHDHVRPSLAELGVQERFWGLALRPGRPAWFGTAAGTLVFGLPGNPVSAMVTFLLLVAPAMRALTGAPQPPGGMSAILDSDYSKLPGRAHAIRVRLRAAADGWHAEPMPAQGSHVLTSMVGADAVALVPTERESVRAGERLAIEPLASWLGARHAA